MTTETEVLPALTPVQLLNEKIAEKKKEAAGRFDKLRRERTAFEKTWPPVIPADAAQADAIKIEIEWQDQRDKLRRVEGRFSEIQVLMELDDLPSSKRSLKAALIYLREKYAAQEQAKAAPVTPTKNGLAALVENALGNVPALEEVPTTFPEPRKLPQGGIWGTVAPLDVAAQLDSLEREIKQFPEGGPTFVRLVETINGIASSLHRAEPPPPLAQRLDRGFTPKHG